MSKIKVLCVDDSALMRQLMTEIVNSHSDMEMVASAPDPLVARELIKQFNPDVLTLDVEMPRMDGLDFLEKLMRLRPMPVVMVSSLTGQGSEITLRAGAGGSGLRHQAVAGDPRWDAGLQPDYRRQGTRRFPRPPASACCAARPADAEGWPAAKQ